MKIDTSLIDGYSEMSAEEKLNALENFEYDDNSAEVERYKKAAAKASSEAADFKRKHKELLSEEERRNVERDEEFNRINEELKTLRKEKSVSQLKAKYLSLGYDEKLAEETALAVFEGNTDKMFENQQKFITERDKAMKVERLKQTPKPAAGEGSTAITKAEIMKIRDATERQAMISENLELFNHEGE